MRNAWSPAPQRRALLYLTRSMIDAIMRRMGIQVTTGRLHFDLETSLFEHVSRAKRRDPCAPVFVVVGSNLLGLYLRRRLAASAGGHINVRFLTFVDLAAMLDDFPGTARFGFAEQAVIEQIIEEGDIPPVFSKVAAARGFGDALLSTFTDIAESGCTVDAADRFARGLVGRKTMSDRVRGTFRLYHRFASESARSVRSMEERFVRAAERAPGLVVDSPVLAYGFYDFNELQLRLIEALGSGPGVILFVPDPGGEAARFTTKTFRRLERKGYEREDARRIDRPAPSVELFSCPGEEEEIGAVARRIVALAEEGVPFRDMGLLVPSMELYLPIIEQAFCDAGVPHFCLHGSRGPASCAARAAEALIGLLLGRIERAQLVDFLASAPLRENGEVPGALHIWIKKSADAGMLGESGWRRENSVLIERLRRNESSGTASRSEVEAVEASAGLIERIERARDEMNPVSSWSGFGRALVSLMRDLFAEDEGFRRVIEVVEDLGTLDAVTGRVTLSAYGRILGKALSDLGGGRWRFSGGGVSILSFGEARGLSFEHLFIAGVAERIFPSMPRQDAFLTEWDRKEINRMTGGEIYLSERLERLDEEAFLFSLALDSASSGLHVSFPRMEQDTGRERIESSFFRFIRRHPFLGGEHTTGRIHRFGLSGQMPLSELEFNMLRAADGEPFRPRLGFFARAVAMEKARMGQQVFTEYEGVFSSAAALEALRARFARSVATFSPTSLESYAGCPFGYFLNKVLELETIEEPERMLQITPLIRGSIVHELLALLFERFSDEGLLPLDGIRRDQTAQTASDVIREFLERYAEREPVGLDMFWDMEKRNITAAVLDYLAFEMDEASGLVPNRFEFWFGRESSVSIRTANGGVSFHGRIDRLDAGPEKGFRVIDYKTGSLDRFKNQDLANGTHLQLPVYMLAAAQLLDRPIEEGIACYRYVGSGKGKREAVFSGALWKESEAEFERIVETVVRGIERGLFWPVPGPSCEYCGVKRACPTGTKRALEAKLGADERCVDYLRMGSGGGGDE
jgi:ATP-dependent helicase/nuclease subunit B